MVYRHCFDIYPPCQSVAVPAFLPDPRCPACSALRPAKIPLLVDAAWGMLGGMVTIHFWRWIHGSIFEPFPEYAPCTCGKTYRFLCVPYRFRRFHPKTKMQPPLHIYIINANFDGISYGCYEANGLGLQMRCTRRFLPCQFYRLIGGAIWNYQSGQYDYLEILWGVLL
jgi:hypothetical protein